MDDAIKIKYSDSYAPEVRTVRLPLRLLASWLYASLPMTQRSTAFSCKVWTTRSSADLAPGGSKTAKVEEGWREELTVSNFIDCQDSFGKW